MEDDYPKIFRIQTADWYFQPPDICLDVFSETDGSAHEQFEPE